VLKSQNVAVTLNLLTRPTDKVLQTHFSIILRVKAAAQNSLMYHLFTNIRLQQQQSFYDPMSGTIQVSRYQKKHPPKSVTYWQSRNTTSTAMINVFLSQKMNMQWLMTAELVATAVSAHRRYARLLSPIYRKTCTSRYPQLRTAGFCC